MARARTIDNRFDLRGGVNTQMTPDLLDTTELRQALNARQRQLGGYAKRTGSRRLHGTALDAGATVTGVQLWQPSDRQLVALAGGNLYYKALAATEFTEVAGTLSASNYARFAPWRDGNDILLLIADGGLRVWDGTTLTESLAGAPAAIDVCVYKGRVFAIAGTKRLYGTALRDYTAWSVGQNGLFQDIETYDAEALVAIAKAGSSLLMAKGNSIARWTGVSEDEIRIDTETEGVSPIVGCIARRTFIELDGVNFTLADTGPYFVTEAGVDEIGLKVADQFDFANRALWADAVATYHRGRREVHLSLPGSGEAGNDTTWILNLRTMGWDGPQRYTFPVTAAARYERADGSESVVVAGDDGFVRDADAVGQRHADDMLANGTGGTNVAVGLTYPPLLAGVPGQVKKTRRGTLRADLGDDAVVTVAWTSELGSGSVDIPSAGAGVRAYEFLLDAVGAAIEITIEEATDQPCEILGMQLPLIYSRKL